MGTKSGTDMRYIFDVEEPPHSFDKESHAVISYKNLILRDEVSRFLMVLHRLECQALIGLTPR